MFLIVDGPLWSMLETVFDVVLLYEYSIESFPIPIQYFYSYHVAIAMI